MGSCENSQLSAYENTCPAAYEKRVRRADTKLREYRSALSVVYGTALQCYIGTNRFRRPPVPRVVLFLALPTRRLLPGGEDHQRPILPPERLPLHLRQRVRVLAEQREKSRRHRHRAVGRGVYRHVIAGVVVVHLARDWT